MLFVDRIPPFLQTLSNFRYCKNSCGCVPPRPPPYYSSLLDLGPDADTAGNSQQLRTATLRPQKWRTSPDEGHFFPFGD